MVVFAAENIANGIALSIVMVDVNGALIQRPSWLIAHNPVAKKAVVAAQSLNAVENGVSLTVFSFKEIHNSMMPMGADSGCYTLICSPAQNAIVRERVSGGAIIYLHG